MLDPDSVATLNGLGTAQKALGRLVEAEASYRRALTVGPDHPELHNNLGDTLRDLGRLSEAESALRRAIELKPDFAAAHFNLGITLNDRVGDAGVVALSNGNYVVKSPSWDNGAVAQAGANLEWQWHRRQHRRGFARQLAGGRHPR